MRFALPALLMLGSISTALMAAEPKRILLVTVTTGYRHTSIETGEKVLRELAGKSGEFTIVSTSEHPDFPDYTGRDPARPPTLDAVRRVMAAYFNPETLETFDGVFFDSTVGELPFPDFGAFLAWVREGHAVMGAHAATDSMHDEPEYAAMFGGEFAGHGRQTVGRMVNFDAAHPATQGWGPSRDVFDELYLFQPNYDRSKVHSLLSMTERPDDGLGEAGSPGWFPMSWTKLYGRGRVFYTALGHREDVWDPTWTDENGQRVNPPEVARAYQQHLLGGIRWALGLAEGDVDPQTKAQ